MANTHLDVIIIQSFLLFIVALVIWAVQSYIILRFARKQIYPVLYKNKLTEWFIAQTSILLHETSHFLSAVFTGSSIVMKESFLTSRAGRVAAVREESVFGWISSVIAAFSPSFLAPFFFSVLLILFAGQQLDISNMFSYPATLEQTLQVFTDSIGSVFVPAIEIFYTSLFRPDIITILLIYLLIVCSIAAGPSEGDWQAALELFASPVSIFAILAMLVTLNFVFAQANIGFVIPIVLLLLFLFVVVVTGVSIAFIFAKILEAAYKATK